jgi:BirA family biotin operon repressor/biotin-[acetyl-CoA-carboxylase] ligase
VAIADEQTAGRGRAGRTWTAPAGTSLLLSAGFRPAYLAADATWRLGAIVGVAMAEAAEWSAGLPRGTIRLKWPNDLVVTTADGVRKIGGVLGESAAIGTADVRAVVGIGVDVDWSGWPLPDDLAATMTTLRTIAGRALAVDALADRFLDRLAERHASLRVGGFPTDWVDRQVTTGRSVVLETPDGARRTVAAAGVDPATGGLLVTDGLASHPRVVHAAEVVHVRLAGNGV